MAATGLPDLSDITDFGFGGHTVLGPVTAAPTFTGDCKVVGKSISLPSFPNLGFSLSLELPTFAPTINFRWGATCAGSSLIPATSCYPPELASYVSADPVSAVFVAGVYSPGLVCPVGWTAACSSTSGQRGTTADNFLFTEIQAGEVAVGCCPSGYGCAEVPFNCVSGLRPTLRPGATLTAPFYNDECSATTTTLTAPTASDIALAWRVNMIVPVGSKFQSSPGDEQGEENGDTRPGESGSGLSVGAKAAIGVAVPIGFLIGLGILAFFCLRRRKQKRASLQRRSEQDGAAKNASTQHELEAVGGEAGAMQGTGWAMGQRHELPSNHYALAELDGSTMQQTYELANSQRRSELPAYVNTR